MGLIMASGCIVFDDPDVVEDESRHGLFWFEINSDTINQKSIRKPNESDDMSVLNMEYVDKWKRLFVYDFKHRAICEFALEFKFIKPAAGKTAKLVQQLQVLQKMGHSEQCAQQ